MPARQRGSVYKQNGAYVVRWVDGDGRRRFRGGFQSKTEARDFLDATVPEAEAVRRGDAGAAARRLNLTVDEAIDRYLAQHDADEATTDKLHRQLKHARGRFGDRHLRSLAPDELGAWRKSLSAGSRHDVFRALRQVLEQAARWKWLDENPARAVKNPKPRPRVFRPFESWDEVDAIAAEVDARCAALPVFLVGTGLRPEEAFALERRNVDREAKLVSIERVFTQGRLKECAKSGRQRRRVPLRQRVLDALDAMPPRIDSPLLFPAARDGHIDAEKWRHREWAPALRAAGIPHRRIYDCRHTYATWSLAAGVNLFTLSRRMGTSLAMIDQTYGHLVLDADEQERRLLDVFDAATAVGAEAR
jgi:integrase